MIAILLLFISLAASATPMTPSGKSCTVVVCNSYFYFWQECECSEKAKVQHIPITVVDGHPLKDETNEYPPDMKCHVINHRIKVLRDENNEVWYRAEIEGVPVDVKYAVRMFFLHEVDMIYYDNFAEAALTAQDMFPVGSIEDCFPELKPDEGDSEYFY